MNRIIRAAQVLGVPTISNAKNQIAKAVTIVLALASMFVYPSTALANTLASSSVALSDPRPSQTSTYTFTVGNTGGLVQSAVVRCVKVTFSTSNASVSTPTGFTAASATITAGSSTLINSSGSGWSFSPASTANTITYVNSTGVTPSTTTAATFIVAGVTNSSVADTGYFAKLNTFGNTDCATTPLDNATTMFINTNGSTLSLTVDPSLTFTVNAVAGSQSCNGTTTTAASTSTTIPFGTVTTASNGVVCQDLTAATNATNGYTIFARYTAAPTNGIGQTIADWTGTNASPTTFPSAGTTEAYGYSTNDATLGTGTANRFTNGGQKWAAMTTSNAELAYEAAGVTSTTYRVGHQVDITALTETGTYSTTVIYTCTPIF